MQDGSASPASGEKRYLHGYETREQERLISQAEFWRDHVIVDGTTQLEPGTRLLDIGCGVGAVLGVLGEAFPGVRLHGVDISAEQIAFARRHLASRGLKAELAVADATVLPYDDGSFDHVWMMWFLEHLKNPVEVLREARRVLAPGGEITVLEGDYSSISARPSIPSVDALLDANRIAMASTGSSAAGPSAGGWLAEAGFTDVDPGKRVTVFEGEQAAAVAGRIANVTEYLIPTLATLPGTASEAELRQGARELRAFGDHPDGRIQGLNYKARALVRRL